MTYACFTCGAEYTFSEFPSAAWRRLQYQRDDQQGHGRTHVPQTCGGEVMCDFCEPPDATRLADLEAAYGERNDEAPQRPAWRGEAA